METWVLIWTIIIGNPDYTVKSGVAITTHSQEFSSRNRCEYAAMQLYIITERFTSLKVGCYPK